ncbi:MAG: methylmalonyl-CoA mutase family protein [Bacteroidales bacterium]
MKSNDHRLFSEFPGISKDAWIEQIRSDLKDPGAMERLIWRSEEGLILDPFYRSEDMESLELSENLWSRRKPATSPNGWINCQTIIPGKDPAMAGEQIMEALRGGAQAIRVRFTGSEGYGLKQLKVMLDHIPLAETEIFFHGGMRIDALYDDLCEVAREHSVQSGHLKGGLGADPLGFMMRTGYPVASMENLGNLTQKVNAQSPFLKVMEVNGGLFQNAGSTLVQELSFTLAMASEYMAMLSGRGLDPATIQESLRLNLTSGPGFYMEIAKFRAARFLWSQLAEGYGIEPSAAKISLHATTASWNQTAYDSYVNMLRGTSQAMSAVIGGADYLTVLPFDDFTGRSNPFSRRIARNVSIIIREEAYLDKVADPASGSYYLENLTHQLGEQAWDLFRQVEARGGFRHAFDKGWIQQQVSESGIRKQQKFNNGKAKLIGTNAYPDPNELLRTSSMETHIPHAEDASLDALTSFRASAPLEEIRMKVENMDHRPRVFLLKYGNPNWAISRAAFAATFFASGGYELLQQSELGSIKDGAEEALHAKAEVVVFCSSDEEYADISSEIAALLGQQSLLIVAGDPQPLRTYLEDAGIHQYIHRHSPLMETLQVINSIVLK